MLFLLLIRDGLEKPSRLFVWLCFIQAETNGICTPLLGERISIGNKRITEQSFIVSVQAYVVTAFANVVGRDRPIAGMAGDRYWYLAAKAAHQAVYSKGGTIARA